MYALTLSTTFEKKLSASETPFSRYIFATEA